MTERENNFSQTNSESFGSAGNEGEIKEVDESFDKIQPKINQDVENKENKYSINSLDDVNFKLLNFVDINPSLHEQIAFKLIDAGEADDVIKYLEKFTSLDHKEIALKLIEAGKGWLLACNLEKFTGLDHKEIALKLIEAGKGWYLAENLQRFTHLDHKEIALKLIEAGEGESIGRNLKKFTGLDEEIALKLIETGQGQYVVYNLQRFTHLDHKEIAFKLILTGQGQCVAHNLEKFTSLDHKEIALKWIEVEEGEFTYYNLKKFTGLDKEVALKLFEKKHGEYVAKYLEKFTGLDKEIALKLIETGQHSYIECVAHNLEKFTGLDEEIAGKLIKAREGEFVIANLEKFTGLDEEIVGELIKVGGGGRILHYLEKFIRFDHKEIALKLIEAGKGESVAYNLEKFTGLDKEVALKLFEKKHGEYVAKHLEKFTGLDEEIVGELIKVGKGECVISNLEKFTGCNHKKIALKFFELGKIWLVASNLQKFTGLDKEIVLKIIETRQHSYIECVVNNLEKFIGLDHKEIALKLIETGQGGSVAYNLEKFIGLDHKEITLKLIRAGQSGLVAENLEKFAGIEVFMPEMITSSIRTNENLFYGNHGEKLVNYCTRHNISIDYNIRTYYPSLHPYQCEIIDVFDNIKYIVDYYKFINKNKELVSHLSESDRKLQITKENLPYIKKLSLQLFEAQKLEEEGVDLGVLVENKNYDEQYEKLKAYGIWNDEQNILKPFEKGAKVFGSEKMFSYLGRDGLSRHDGLHAFTRIIGMKESSGISTEQFYQNILWQVGRDSANYGSGTAHHELNSIAQSINLNIQEVLEKARSFKEIDMLQELTQSFNNLRDVFSSWRSLKRYIELTTLLRRTEILDELKELKVTGKKQLYKYIETLTFHPVSNVSMPDVIRFWREPLSFLSEGDTHTPEKIQDRKKPSNYVNIPHLDLSAEELRDALVEGDMDSLQVFTPMEVVYRLPKGEVLETSSFIDRLKIALGSRSEGVVGKAKNPRKLFSGINKELQRLQPKVTINSVLVGEYPPEQQTDIDQIVETYLADEEIGLPVENRIEFVARIHSKSSPEGVLAGNDTVCCMPFGAGKNTVYMFNPDTAQFTLQIVKADGSRRTIAQSVLTKDKDVKKSIPEILSEIQESSAPDIKEILPEEVLNTEPAYLTCDNVEVAPNFKTEEYSGIIERIYRNFFAEYMKRYAKAQNLNPDFVPIGKGYSDSLTNLSEIPNTFAPLAPVGYSDKTHDSVYKLDLWEDQHKLKGKVNALESEKKTTQLSTKGVTQLTFEDTLSVAFLESKAYQDNVSLIQYLHNIENALIAKDINNSAKDRPNMSFKYTDSKKRVRGYILTYEGRYSPSNSEYDNEDDTSRGEPIIYISDLAADPDSVKAGGNLIRQFIDSYKEHYLAKNNPIPIYAEAREQTSYKILSKQLEKIASQLGVDYQMEELETYQHGEDTMHPVMIRIK